MILTTEDGTICSDGANELVTCHVCGAPVGDVYDGEDPAVVEAIATGALHPICDGCQDPE